MEREAQRGRQGLEQEGLHKNLNDLQRDMGVHRRAVNRDRQDQICILERTLQQLKGG